MFRDTVLRKDKKEIMIIKTLQKEKKKKDKIILIFNVVTYKSSVAYRAGWVYMYCLSH